MKRSLRNKIFSLLFAYAVILVLLFGFAMVFAAFVIEDEGITKRLLLEAKYLKAEYSIKADASPRGKHFKLYFRFKDLPEALKPQMENKLEDTETIAVGNKEYRYFHFFIGIGQEAYLVVDVSEISLLESTSEKVIVILAAFLLLTLILSVGLTVLITNNTVYPLIKLTNAIKKQQSIIPTLPKDLLSKNDELGYLTNSLKNSYQKLSLALERESEFTRDVSHELRTPISVMVNTLSLAQGEPLPMIKQKVLEHQVKLISNQVQILLALARAESIEKEYVSLLSIVEEAVLSLHKMIEEKGFSIDINVDRAIKVNANEHLLKLMLANLIENAMKYSSDNGMTIFASETELTVSNKTNHVINNELVSKYNKSPNSNGIGQGLFLVSRILESMEWSFELAPSKTIFNLRISFELR